MRISKKLLFTIYVIAFPSTAIAQDIRGVVVNSAGKPLEGVTVELFPSSRRDTFANTKTNNKGEYLFKSPKLTAAFEVVYSHSKMDDVVVSRLSEGKSQDINIVQYMRGEKRTIVAYVDALQAVEKLYFLYEELKAGSHTGIELDSLAKHFNTENMRELLGSDVNTIARSSSLTNNLLADAKRKSLLRLLKINDK